MGYLHYPLPHYSGIFPLVFWSPKKLTSKILDEAIHRPRGPCFLSPHCITATVKHFESVINSTRPNFSAIVNSSKIPAFFLPPEESSSSVLPPTPQSPPLAAAGYSCCPGLHSQNFPGAALTSTMNSPNPYHGRVNLLSTRIETALLHCHHPPSFKNILPTRIVLFPLHHMQCPWPRKPGGKMARPLLAFLHTREICNEDHLSVVVQAALDFL